MAAHRSFLNRSASQATTRRRSFPPIGALDCALGAVILLILGTPEPAAAHAAFDRGDPMPNTILSAPPAQATIWFTEPLEHSYTKAELYDQAGQLIPGATSRFDDGDRQALILNLPSGLANGTYSVVWQTLSAADGHTAQGYFAFTIGTEADVHAAMMPVVTSDSSGTPQWLRTISRWIPLLGLAIVAAIWPIWLLVLRPAISPAWQAGPALTRRAHRLTVIGVAVMLLGSIVALVVQADNSAGEDGLFTATRTTLTDTRYGDLWQLRIGLLLAFAFVLLACAWWRPRRRRLLASVALVLALALPLPFSLNSHASAQTSGRTVAIAVDMLHLLGAAIWVGGLFALVAVLIPTLRDLTPAGRRVVLARAIPRFSAVALTAWIVLGLTGLYNAWLQVGNLDGLLDTSYGHSLIAKLLLLTPALALAAINLLVISRGVRDHQDDDTGTRWSRRFTLAVGGEVVLVVLVLLVVGRLTSQQPARESLAQETAHVTAGLSAQDRAGTLTITPGSAGPNHYRLVLDGDPVPDGTEALLRLTVPNVATGQQEVTLDRVAANAFEMHGSEISLAGDWTVEAIVRKIGELQWQATAQIEIAATAATPDLPGDAWHFSTSGLVGLALIVAGVAGLIFSWAAGRSPLRKESLGLGAAALAIGVILLVQARVEPASAENTTAPPPAPADAAAITRGQELYLANCAQCHGADARGNGPEADGLNPAPADFTSAHSVSHADADYREWITNGKFGTAMPAFGTTLSAAEIDDVITYLRALQRGEAPPAATAAP